MIIQPLYEFVIKDKSGNTMVTLDSARNRQFKFYMNKPSDAQFDVSLTDAKLTNDMLLLGNKELYIYRAGVLVWGGELTSDDETIDDQTEIRTVYAKGFANLLSKKIIGSSASPDSHTAEDAGSIVSGLITSSQSGINEDLGITNGVIQTSVNRTIDFQFETLLDIIEHLSSDTVDDGFEFDVDPLKVFSLWYPQRGTERDDIIVEYGKNFTKYTRQGDASDMANEIIIYGAGSGVTQAQETVDDTGLQPQYGIRQATLAANSISDTTLLISIAQQYLNLIGQPYNTFTIDLHQGSDPALGTYGIGDSIRLIVKKGLTQIDDFFRVYEIDVALTDDDDEDVTLTLSNTLRKTFLDKVIDLKKRIKILETTQ